MAKIIWLMTGWRLSAVTSRTGNGQV